MIVLVSSAEMGGNLSDETGRIAVNGMETAGACIAHRQVQVAPLNLERDNTGRKKQMNEPDKYAGRSWGPPQRLKTRRASTTPMKQTRWAIPDFLPRGELTALAGPKASGKSTIYCAIAAAISNGANYASWLGELNKEPSGVLIMSSEDDVERTIIPRLIAAGADLARIEFIDGTDAPGINIGSYRFDPGDNERIRNTANNLGGVSLIIVDPWSSVIDGDARNKNKVRRKLENLLDLAKTLDVAILLIGHVVKNSKGSDPITRFSGSAAVTEVSRSLFITAQIEEGPDEDGSTHILVRAVTNLGKGGGGFAYSIEEAEAHGAGISVITSKIKWHNVLEGRAEDILNSAEKSSAAKKLGAPEKAAIFLSEFLRDGPRLKPDILKEAGKLGIAPAALNRAKKALGITSAKQKGAGKASPFIWALDPNSDELDDTASDD
ncbi:MAG: AAA family ATPase [Burkholderiaceae bacterium]|nr:AAA family ATPase [Burkholderiaceae bacterium]